MDILDDMGVSKLSAKVFFLNVNYSFNASFLAEWKSKQLTDLKLLNNCVYLSVCLSILYT